MPYNDKAQPLGTHIVFLIDSSLNLPSEGYKLTVRSDKAVFEATQPVGLFWGVQTFVQLIQKRTTVDYNSESAESVMGIVRAVKIEDYPHFQWRGLLLGFILPPVLSHFSFFFFFFFFFSSILLLLLFVCLFTLNFKILRDTSNQRTLLRDTLIYWPCTK